MSGFAEGLKHHVLQLQFLLLFNIYLLLLFIVCATEDASINKGDFGINLSYFYLYLYLYSFRVSVSLLSL